MVRMVSTQYRHNGRCEFGPMVIAAEPVGEPRKRDRSREYMRRKRKGKKRGRRGKSLFGD